MGVGRRFRAATLAVIGLVFVSLAGCAPGKYTGGGFIKSVAGGNAKATFGFNLEGIDRDGDGLVDMIVVPDPACPDDCFIVWWLGKGQCDFHDHGAGVQFHYECDAATTLRPDGSYPPGMFARFNDDFSAITGFMWFGYYTSPAGTGKVSIVVTANGDSIDSSDDTIEVTLTDGPYDGYHNIGTLQGGNIQWHPAK